MDISLLLPILAKATGKDITNEIALFYRAKAAVGKSLSPEGQVYVSNNIQSIVSFMESPKGVAALSDFFDAWVNSLEPVSVTAGASTAETPPPEPVLT